MSLFSLLSNTVEGALQTAVGTTKIAASPVTQLVDPDTDSHFEDAAKNISDGLRKIGDPSDDH